MTTSVTPNNNVTIKTIYDPSVVGFCLPKTAAYTGTALNGIYENNPDNYNVSGSFNYGYKFYTNGWKSGGTIFLSALGTRDTYTTLGLLYKVLIDGYYYTDGVGTSGGGLYLAFGSGRINCQASQCRSMGNIIWPAKEI